MAAAAAQLVLIAASEQAGALSAIEAAAARCGPMTKVERCGVRELLEGGLPWPTGRAVLIVDGGLPRAEWRALLVLAERHGVPVIALGASVRAEADHPGVIALELPVEHRELAGAVRAAVQREPGLERLRQLLALEQSLKVAAGRELARQHGEMDLASQLQRAFLPAELPETAEYELDRLFRPVGSLSGDIYDAMRLDEHTLAFFVADACGHGLPAAMLTMLIGRTLPMRETVGQENAVVPPGEALRRLNAQFIQRRAGEGSLVTAMYGLLDTRDGTVTLAGAGHPAAAIIRGGTMRLVHSEGPAMGVFEDGEFPQTRFTLEPGETLLLHTDGFEQAFVIDHTARRRPSELYRDAFVDLFGQSEQRSLAHAMAEMACRLDEQHGSLHQIDDLTLLAVMRRKHAASGHGDVPLRKAA
jgi:phosphoserine phosphatase RsbU/P